jgi:hypothetical protein
MVLSIADTVETILEEPAPDLSAYDKDERKELQEDVLEALLLWLGVTQPLR